MNPTIPALMGVCAAACVALTACTEGTCSGACRRYVQDAGCDTDSDPECMADVKWFCFMADDEDSCLDRLEEHCWPEDNAPPATLYTTDEPFDEDCDDCDKDCAKGPPLAM